MASPTPACGAAAAPDFARSSVIGSVPAVRIETPVAEQDDSAIAATAAIARDGAAATRLPFTLHVVDRDTREQLAECEALFGPKRDFSYHSVSGESPQPDPPDALPPIHASLIASGHSPLRVTPTVGSRRLGEFWVRARGYETVPLVIDWASGGQHTAPLRKSGSLTVMVDGAPEGAAIVVSLVDAERLHQQTIGQLAALEHRGATRGPQVVSFLQRRLPALAALSRVRHGPIEDPEQRAGLEWMVPFAHVPRRDLRAFTPAELTVADLGVGAWLVQATLAPDAEHDPEIPSGSACGIAIVDSREPATLRLTWQQAPATPTIPLRGRVVFAPEWSAPGMPPLPAAITLQSLADDALFVDVRRPPDVALHGKPRGERTFAAADFPVGPAVACFHEWHWAFVFEVPADPEQEVVLRVPPPCRVRCQVRALDAPELSAQAELRFAGCADDASWFGLSDLGALATDADGRVEFVLPQGWLDVCISNRSWAPERLVNARIDRPLVDLDLEAREPSQVNVTLTQSGTVVSDATRWLALCTLTTRDRPLTVLGWTYTADESSATLFVDGAGPASLAAPAFAEWLAVPPTPVELVRGAKVAVTIPLEPAR